MGAITGVLVKPLGMLLDFGYSVTGSYGLAILFFAFAAKVITFPLALTAQKNSIRLLRIQPELAHIKRAHYGDKERVNEEQYLLYQREKYSPISGLFPLLAQLALLVGMGHVLYQPFAYLPDLTATVFWGLDLAAVPDSEQLGAFFALALLSGLSSFALCAIQNRLNPAQRRMSFWGRWGLSMVVVAFSFYIPFVTSGAIGLYWFFSNLFSIVVAFAVNFMDNPKKSVAPELLVPPEKPSKEERRMEKQRRRRILALENESVRRFHASADPNKLVFYSVSGGQYQYYSEMIDWLLANSDLTIHYLTNDPEDVLLETERERWKVYYIGQKRAVGFMLRLDAAMVIMTAPNLGQYHIKRSVVNPDIEYVYTFHHFTSLVMLREEAVDHFDTVFCAGRHHIEEIRRTEQLYGLRPKRLVKVGYGQIDRLLKRYAEMPKTRNSPPQILIAPSWSVGGILDTCLDELVCALKEQYTVVIRPHPEYLKRFPEKWLAIVQKYEGVVFDADFLRNESIYRSDLLITDWSSIANEFSYCTKRPTIYINTPMKIMNSEYQKLGMEPLDVILRSRLGENIDPGNLAALARLVPKMLSETDKYRERISRSVEEYLFYPGRSGEAAGRYIVSRLTGRKDMVR
ncbi:MAG: membrane protein insertase YidC [Clostridium sp.]|jgi:YidC/Oxa1 family membrane protein insertase|nr:membrane protein insertase YidC [Clostridium sp.]